VQRGERGHPQATQCAAPTAPKRLRRGDHGEGDHHRRCRQPLLLPLRRRPRCRRLALGNHGDFQVLPTRLAGVDLAGIDGKFHVSLRLTKIPSRGLVPRLERRHRPAMPLDQRPRRPRSEADAEHLAQVLAVAAKDTSAASRQQCFWTVLLKRPSRPSMSSAAYAPAAPQRHCQ